MAIRKADRSDLESCVDILFVPELGMLYHPRKEFLRDELADGIDAGEVFVDTAEDGETIRGVVWYQVKSLFNAFPYLHMIAVHEAFRNQGVGQILLDFFEQDSLRRGANKLRAKVYLLVNASNNGAQEFYLNRGYEEVCRFENLFRKGMTEILLMKSVKKNSEQLPDLERRTNHG